MNGENMDITIIPNQLTGEVLIPPSKSYTHRALICAGLSKGRSIINNPLFSDDTMMTINALRTFGVTININTNYLEVFGVEEFKVSGPIEVCDSASTLRFLLPILAISNDEFIIKGSRRLMERVNTSDLDKLIGLNIKVNDDNLHVKGKLEIKAIDIDDSLTSQLISGILFTLPITKKPFKRNSNNSYVQLTMHMMMAFGIKFYANKEYMLTSGQYTNAQVEIESDYSNAAFFIVMAVLNKDIKLKGLKFKSLQGDRAILSYLEKMGVVFNYQDFSIIKNNIHGIELDLSLTPDLVPVIAAIATVARGRSVLTGLDKLVLKESNRIVSTYESLKALGADIEISANKLIINGKDKLAGGVTISSYNDHRIIMALCAISSKVLNPYTITNAEHISKSLPSFFELYRNLGGIYESKLSE